MPDSITSGAAVAFNTGESGPTAACDAEVSIEIKPVDDRSSQFTCTVQVQNTGSAPLDVLSIRPRLPQGVALNEAVDPTARESTSRHKRLCSQISFLLTDLELTSSQAFSAQVVSSLEQSLKEALRLGTWTRAYVQFLTGARSTERIAEARRARFAEIEVYSARDAKQQFERLMSQEHDAASSPVATTVEAEDSAAPSKKGLAWLRNAATAKAATEQSDQKARRDMLSLLGGLIRQLETLEADTDYQTDKSTPTIQPQGKFSVLYILRATRPWFESRVYPVYADVILGGDGRVLGRTKGEPLLASPPSGPLTFIAILFAFVGVILNAIAQLRGAQTGADPGLTVAVLGAAMPPLAGDFIVGALTALIAFNLFEYTILKDKLGTNKINWRLAAFVGLISGLLSEKIVAVFQGFLAS